MTQNLTKCHSSAILATGPKQKGASVSKRILQVLKRATKERTDRKGNLAEEKFLEAMKTTESSVQLPLWVKDVYLTERWSPKDRNQVDAVVETPAGLLHIQIKSSEREARRHFTKFTDKDSRRNRIGVIVVRPDDTYDDIRKVARMVLEDLRNKLPLGARAQIED